MKRLSFFLLILLPLAGCNQSDNSINTGNQPPVISSITPAEVLRGQTIDGRIQGSNLNGVTGVDIGDGLQLIAITSAVSQEIGVRFFVNNDAVPGPRTVTVHTSSGSASTSSMLSVGGNRAPVAQFKVDPLVGVTQTVFTFDATGSSDQDGTISGYGWDFGDGQTAGGKKVTHKFNSAGKFNVKLTVTDNDQGQTLASRDLEVKGGKLPIARFNVSPADGDTQTLFRFDGGPSTDPDGRIVSWEWFFGDGGRQKGKIAEHRFRSAGPQSVRLVVTDNDQLESDIEKKVRIRGTPPIASFTISPDIGNVGTNFRFDASSSHDPSGNIVSYAWNFGDGSTGSGAVVMHTYAVAKTYAIKLTVTDNDGTVASSSRNFRVYEGDDPGPGPGPGPNPGPGTQCTTPAGDRGFIYGTVLSVEGSNAIVQLDSGATCANSYYRCGDMRRAEPEQFRGIIHAMEDRGNGVFSIFNDCPFKWPPDIGERVFLYYKSCSDNYCP